MFTNNVGGRNSNQGGRGLSLIVERSIRNVNRIKTVKMNLTLSNYYISRMGLNILIFQISCRVLSLIIIYIILYYIL